MRISDWSSDVCSSDLDEILTDLRADRLQKIAKVDQDRIVAVERPARLRQVVNTQQGQRTEQGNAVVAPRAPARTDDTQQQRDGREIKCATALIDDQLHVMTPQRAADNAIARTARSRSEEHTSELQSLMRISY